jgi:hypothetical protein
MIELLTNDGLRPFLLAGGLVVGFAVLELIFASVGIDTQIGSDAEAPVDFDVEPAADGASGGMLDMIGLRSLPLTVWLALCAAIFAGIGLSGQTLIHAIFGAMLSAGLASALAIVPTLGSMRAISRMAGRWLPRETSAAISERSYGRRLGVVTVGTAKRGNPAQIRFTDLHGNMHFAMAEPARDEDEIPEGAEVFITRTRDGALRLVRVD